MTTTSKLVEAQHLECGTSLAESEFENASLLPSREPRPSASTAFVEPESTKEQPLDNAREQDSSRSGSLSRIAALRQAIVQDLVVDKKRHASDLTTDSTSYTTFASPFEIPSGGSTRQEGRFLQVPLVYCDHTASNRPCASLEKYWHQTCLPWYANTHTNTSVTGSQSTALVAEARQLVAEHVNAKITGKASLDVVLFAGNGATASVELLIDCLGLRHYDRPQRPVVFCGPYEHHSNLVPWREAGCEVVMVPSSNQKVDLQALERLLQQHQDAPLKMGAFSAASNVTGQVTNVQAVASLLHRYQALAFFDFATAAPYADGALMNMNPTTTDAYMDALYFSPHKLLGGGAGTPGVLVLKKALVSQVNAPSRSGGGTVFYVTNDHHRFLSHRVERYEGGTPHIGGIWRIGLALLWKRHLQFAYQERVDGGAGATLQEAEHNNGDDMELQRVLPSDPLPSTLAEYDLQTYERVASYLQRHAPNLVLLGPSSGDDGGRRWPIFSFLIRFQHRFLHFNYVCAILNDLFGIQSRGGCQCAGPYSQQLLGLTPEINKQVEQALVQYKERAELLRPGYTRLSLPFKGLTNDETLYVVQALVWVSKHAWALMCQYRCNHRTGEWRHATRQGKPLGKDERKWLSHYAPPFASPIHNSTTQQPANDDDAEQRQPPLAVRLKRTLQQADNVLAAAKANQGSIAQALKMANAEDVLGGSDGSSNDDLERLRWYVYPQECAVALQQQQGSSNSESRASSSWTLMGALNPATTTPAPASDTVSDDRLHMEDGEDGHHIDKKRKMNVPSVPAGEGAFNAAAKDFSMVTADTVLPFRDGEHHGGEAAWGEIQEGMDDGELSDETQVFVHGEWVNAKRCVASQQDDPARDAKESAKSETGFQAKKKAPRDQSSWGQGHVVAGPSSALSTADRGDAATVAPLTATTEEATRNETTEQPKNGLPNGSKKRARTRHIRPPPKLMRLVTQAVFQWDMIQEGDRLLLGLSGGKDSLSLLHCLLELQRKLPTRFELEVCTIDPMTPSFDPSPLIPYVRDTLGLKYHYIRDDIVARATSAGKDGSVVSSLCAYCARMKRGNLYNVARQQGCNKLVLAQHLDDCAESFFMSVMHNGFLRTMKAHYEINAGDLSVIRPLVYCRERLMTDFAKAQHLPVINENCPACFEEPKERARVKKLLSREELNYPNFYDSLRRSLMPLLHADAEAVMHSFTQEAASKSQKQQQAPNKGSKPTATKQPNGSANQAEPSAEAVAENGVQAEAAGDAKAAGGVLLSDASEEELVAELARRRAAKFRLVGAMKQNKKLQATPATTTVGEDDAVSPSLCQVGGACSHFD